MRALQCSALLMAWLACLGTVGAFAMDAPLRVGVPRNFPPHVFIDSSGRPQGFAIELFERIARQEGLQYEYRIYNNWPATLHALRKGDIDLIPNIGITPDREQWFDFTRPAEAFRINVFVRKSTPEIVTLDDLAGRKVGAVQSNQGLFLIRNKTDWDIQVHITPNEALTYLIAAEDDAVVYPAPVMWRLAKENGVAGQIRTVGPALAEVKRGMAVRKGDEHLRNVLDNGVEKFLASPEYNELYAKWFGAPHHFWTAWRVFWLFLVLLASAVLAALLVRYRTASRLNKRLAQSLDEAHTTVKEREALLEATEAVLVQDRFEDAAIAVLEQCRKTIDTARGYVFLPQKDGSWGEQAIAASGAGDRPASSEVFATVGNLLEQIGLRGSAVSGSGFGADAGSKRRREGPALRNALLAPLKVEGKIVGLIALADKKGEFTERDLRMGEAFADLAAISLTQDLHLRRLAESEKKYRILFDQAPVALWEKDFSEIKPQLDALLERGLEQAVEYFETRQEEGKQLLGKVRLLDINQAGLALHQAESKEQFMDHAMEMLIQKPMEDFLRTMHGLARNSGAVVDQRSHRTLTGRRLDVQMSWLVAPGHEQRWDRVLVSMHDLTALRKAEEEQRFMSFALDQAPTPAFVTRPDGSIRYANQTACLRLGYSRNELLQMNLVDLDPNFPNGIPSSLEKELQSSEIKFESTHRTKDGQAFPVEITARQAHYGDENCVISFAVDISERRRSLQLLQESETRFRELFGAMTNGAAVYRMVGDGEDFLFQDLNRAGEKITGKNRGQLAGRSLLDVFPGALELGLIGALQRVGRTGQPETLSMKQYQDRRLSMWVSNSLYRLPSGEVVAVFNDETERKRAEDELRRLAAAVEQAGESIVIFDAEGIVQYVNPAFLQLSGYPQEDLLGKEFSILRKGLDEDELHKKLWEFVQTGKTWRGRVTNRRKDGSLYAVEMTASPVADAEGAITHFVAIMRDVAQQEALERQLRQAQKMEAIGALAGGIAHDFNNILMSIMGFCDLASRNIHDVSKASTYLQHVKTSSERGADLVRRILTFSRPSDSEKSSLDPEPVIHEAMRLLQATMPGNISVIEETGQDLPRILSNPTALHQIVINLGANAMHAMSDRGGRLTMRLAAASADEVKSSQSKNPAKRWLLIEVTDTGCGMSEEVAERAFEPFFTTKGPGKGTGLGLSVVHGLVQDHQGAANIESSPGQGTKVSIYLPAFSGETQFRPLEDSAEDPTGNERVLFVDDEQAIRTMVEEGLSALGYAVRVCASGDEALRLFFADAKAFDIVVTDLSMPGLGGMELAEAIRAQEPQLPVIICSGYAEAVPGRGAVHAMAAKPFTAATLAGRIRRTLTDRRKLYG
ncbi:MAG: PAS domain S-box protein [Desulfovibrionaceae bacterium]